MSLMLCGLTLGGSMLPQTLRSDFDSLLAATDKRSALHENRTISGSSDFIQALAHILSGDFSAAQDVLSAIQTSIADGVLTGVWPVRLAILRALKVSFQISPPLLGFWKSLDGVSYLLHDSAAQFEQVLTAMFESAQLHQASFTERDWLEFRTVNTFVMMPFNIWGSAISFHNGSPRIFHATPAFLENAREQLEQGRRTRKGLIDLARQYGEPRLEHDLELLDLQTELASDSQSWRQLYMSLRESAVSRNDHPSIGLLDMMLADKLVSPAFTSPLALNLIAVESYSVDCSSPNWDPVEHTLCLQSSQEVDELYQVAYETFSKGGASRGCGAIMLRQACLLYGSHCDDEYVPTADVLRAARKKLEDASKLLATDFTQTQIVQCHLVILDVLQGDDKSAIHRAADIGQACINAQNTNAGRFIGMLLLRFGRRQLDLHSRLDIALRSYRCAEACATKLEALPLILKALIAQSEAFSGGLNSGAALDILHRHRPLFWTLIHELDRKRKPKLNGQDAIVSLQMNLFQTYSEMTSLVYLRANHPTQMQHWNEEVKAWVALPEIMEHRERIHANKDVTGFALGHIPEEERPNAWSKADFEQMWLRRYTIALNRHRRAREAMDMEKADSVMHHFVGSLEEDAGNLFALRLWILACNDIGDTERARILLRNIPYDRLFSRAVKSLYHGPELWVRLIDTRYFVEQSGVEVGLHLSIMCNDWDTGKRIVDEIQTLVPTFLLPTEKIVSRDMAFRLTHAAILSMNTGNDEAALSLILEVVRFTERRRYLTSDADSRRGSTSNSTMSAIHVVAATLCERNSHKELSLPTLRGLFPSHSLPESWLEAAVLFEEQGKARQLRDHLDESEMPIQASTTQTRGDHDLLLQLRRLPPTERTEDENEELLTLEAMEQASSEYPVQTQKLPGYRPADLNLGELFAMMPDKVVVLSMSFSRYSSMLFAMDRGGIRQARPIELTDIAAERLAIKIINMISYPDEVSGGNNITKLNEQIKELSRHIIAPVENLIDGASHIVFVPGQPLTNFPFHVLQYRGDPLFLSKSVSLVPSLATFQHLLGRQRHIEPDVAVICKPSTPAEYARVNENLIPMASIEAISIARLFGRWPQASSTIDRKSFKATLDSSAVVHVGVHGRRHTISPWLAHLSLKEKLYVLDFAYMRNAAGLIVFSACLSGRGYATQGNDELGFATAVLASGCQCYIGALWEIDDLATLLLMTAFYKHLASTPGITVAEMLRLAQCELFHMTRSMAIDRLKEIEQVMHEAALAGEKVEELVRKPKMLLKRQAEHVPDSFAHPFYWASFMPVGNALIQVRQ